MLRIILAASLVLIAHALPLNAQPARSTILGDITTTSDHNCVTVRIGMNFPLRYLGYFTNNSLDELRIQIRPVAAGPLESKALSTREAVAAEINALPLHEIVYEGDAEQGPYLTLHFQHPVRAHIKQGADFRSIVVSFPSDSDSTSACQKITATSP